MMALKRVVRAAPDLHIKKGLLAVHQGRAVRVMGVHSGGRIHLRVEGKQEFIWADVSTIESFVSEAPQKTIRAPNNGDPEKELLAARWCEVLGQIAALHPSAVKEADYARIAADMDVSSKTVRRRLKAYRANPMPASQLTSTPGPLPGSRRLSPLVESLSTLLSKRCT